MPLLCLLKQDDGIDDLLSKIITLLPSPSGTKNKEFKCMLVDSWYDSYLGVVVLVRVVNGELKKVRKLDLWLLELLIL